MKKRDPTAHSVVLVSPIVPLHFPSAGSRSSVMTTERPAHAGGYSPIARIVAYARGGVKGLHRGCTIFSGLLCAGGLHHRRRSSPDTASREGDQVVALRDQGVIVFVVADPQQANFPHERVRSPSPANA